MGWESEEFNTIDLGDKCLDKRLDKRAVLLAERMAASPSKSIPGACQGGSLYTCRVTRLHCY